MRKAKSVATATVEPDYIEPSLWPLAVPVADLHEDPANVRQHPERSIQSIAASLKRFRQQKPIVIGADGLVIAGNGTLSAAKSLGWEFVAALRSETLSASRTEATAFGLADNRTQELSSFDFEGVSSRLQALEADGVSREGLGWDADEHQPLLEAEWKAPEHTDWSDTTGGDKGHSITFDDDQWLVVERAIEAARERFELDGTNSQCLTEICSKMLAE
jgi:hypothetical protein